MVHLERIKPNSQRARLLRALVERHQQHTDSPRAAWVLDHWDTLLPCFWCVAPDPALEGERAVTRPYETLAAALLDEVVAESHAVSLSQRLAQPV